MSVHKYPNNNEYIARAFSNMGDLRAEIDQLDRIIVELLSVRQGYMEQAAHIKGDRNLIRDEARIEDVVRKVMQHARKVDADPALVEQLYRHMIEWCISYEMDVFDSISQQPKT